MTGVRIVLPWLIALLAWLPPHAALAQAIPTPSGAGDIQSNSATNASGGVLFRAAGALATAANGNVAPGLPAGTANNDILICIVESYDNVAPTIAAPAGWTRLNTGNGGTATHQASVFWKRAVVPGEVAPTVTHAAGSSIAARCLGFSGVNTVTAFDVANSFTFSAADLTTEAAAITTVTNGAMLVFVAMMDDNHTSLAAPTGTATVAWTQAFFSAFNGAGAADVSIGAYYGYADDPGTYGPLTATRAGGANAVSHGALLALRPASTTGNFTINKPTNTVQDDVLVASIAVAPNRAAIVPPAGWTEVQKLRNANANSNQLRVYYKVAGAVEGASYSWFISGVPTAAANGISGGIVRFQNVDTATPIDVFGGQNTLSALTHATPAPGPTTTVDDVMLVTSHAYASSSNWTPPAAMTEFVDDFSAGVAGAGGISLSVNGAIQATPGATGAKTATAAGANADVGNAQILALRPRVHHFNIAVSGTGACTPTLTITAQDASNNTVTNYAGTINLSTSLSHGDWAAGSPAPAGTLTNGAADDGAATYQFASGDAGVVVLKLLNNRNESMTVTVVDSTRSSTSTTSASIAFQLKTLAIANDSLQIAGKDQAMTATVQGNGSACTGYTGSLSVRAWYTPDADDPGGTAPSISGMTSPPLGTSVPGANNLTLSFTSGVANFTLVTTDVGKYVINLRDASQTFVTGNLDASSPAITARPFALAFPGIQHSTDQNGTFLAKAGASFSATVRAYLWQAADDSNNDGVPDAGANVTDNGATSKFAWPVTISAGASLPSPGTTGTMTRGGGGAATIAQGSFSGGSATASDLEYSEVGNVILIATATNYLNSGVTVGGANSGNSGLDGTGSAGGYVGRFTPSKFVLTADGANGPVLVNRSSIGACADPATTTTGAVGGGSGSFTVTSAAGFATGDTIVVVGAGTSAADHVTTVTVSGTTFTLGAATITAVGAGTPVRKLGLSYMNDRFTVTFRLTAQNAFNNPTNNYTGSYAKLNLGTAASLGLGALNGTTNLTSRLDTSAAPSGSFNSSGQADLTVTLKLARATPDAPDGPYDTLRVGIAPDDNDPSGNGTRIASFNLDVDNNATNEHASIGTTRVRFGRLRIQNASGSEAIGASLPISAQYWTGSGYATNTLDSCTSLAQGNLALDGYSGAVNPGAGNCKTYVNNAPITLSSGQGTIKFSAPSAAGSLRVTARLGALGAPTDYCTNAASPPTPTASDATGLSSLLGRWNDASNPDSDANTSSDDNPSARAAFGVYGAQPRNFIFFRENY